MILYNATKMPHLKVKCQELSRDVPPYPTKNAYLNFPNPKAFYMNNCSQLTFFLYLLLLYHQSY